MLKSHLLLAVALPALLVFSACQRGTSDIGEGDDGELLIGQTEVSETISRGVNPGNRTLVIEGFSGVIELTGTDGPNAQLEFTKRARGRDDATARETLAGISVDESGADDSYRFQLDSDRRDRSAVDVRGTVPVGTPLRLEMANGAIAVSGADGPVTIDVSNGTVRVGGTSRDVNITVRNGDVDLGLRMIPPDGSIRVETSNGNITMRMPAASSARVDARTSVGTVIVEGLDFSSRRLQREAAGSSFSGQLGGGNANIELRVQNGVIRMAEGQTLTLDGFERPDTAPEPVTPEESLAPTDTLNEETAPPDTNAVSATP